MRMPRTSIAGLMGAVLVASLGLTALRSGSAVWAGTTFLVTCGVLALAVVGVVCRAGPGRAWWLGFALFGWGYLVLVFWGWLGGELESADGPPARSGSCPGRPGRAAWAAGSRARLRDRARSTPMARRGTASSASLVATLGGLLALGLFGAAAPPIGRPTRRARPTSRRGDGGDGPRSS